MSRILIPRSDNISSKLVAAADWEKYFNCQVLQDYVIGGLAVTAQCPNILAVDIASGSARVKGLHLCNSTACAVTCLTACSTNKIYMLICRDGCSEPDEWTFNKTTGCVPADGYHIANAVTNACTVTSVVQTPAIRKNKNVFGFVGTGTEINSICPTFAGMQVFSTCTASCFTAGLWYHQNKCNSAWVEGLNPAAHSAALVTSGTLAVARGGTGVTSSTGTTNTVLSGSPTIVTPTIASMTNAQHDHENAAGGGALAACAITSGILGVARVPDINPWEHHTLACAATAWTITFCTDITRAGYLGFNVFANIKGVTSDASSGMQIGGKTGAGDYSWWTVTSCSGGCGVNAGSGSDDMIEVVPGGWDSSYTTFAGTWWFNDNKNDWFFYGNATKASDKFTRLIGTLEDGDVDASCMIISSNTCGNIGTESEVWIQGIVRT